MVLQTGVGYTTAHPPGLMVLVMDLAATLCARYLDHSGQAPYTSATPEMDVIFEPLPGFGLMRG
jgi:hypothetical protein